MADDLDQGSPEICNLEQLKELQLRLLGSLPKSQQTSLGATSGVSRGGHRRNKFTVSAEEANALVPPSVTRGRHQDGTDLANIKSFIKKQVIKFYQNNLV